MRHPMPIEVKNYYEAVKKGAPPCCHTCESYADNGICLEYHMTPPEDFAASIGKCPMWIGSIPF